MFDIGFSELLLIGLVALIVVGPKDLPGMFRTVGKFMGKARGMAREFQRSMEAAADESGLKEASDSLKSVSDIGLKGPKKSAKQFASDFMKDDSEKILNTSAKDEPNPEVEAPAVAATSKIDAPAKKGPAKKAPAKKPTKAKPAPRKKAAPKSSTNKTASKSSAPKSASSKSTAAKPKKTTAGPAKAKKAEAKT